MVAEEGVKLYERSEFLPPPRRCGLRGESKTKLLGAFSLVRFFGARKEMNVKVFKFLKLRKLRVAPFFGQAKKGYKIIF